MEALLLDRSLINTVSQYYFKQVKNFCPDGIEVSFLELEKIVEISLLKLKITFSYLNSKYYQDDFEKIFNLLNGDHYSMLLYSISRNFFIEVNNENYATKTFLLNKMLHGIDVFYKVKLPEVFLFVHPLGTVLGNANYGNFFCVYQGCTVGSKVGQYVYPEFGEKTILYSHSSIIGKCKIGNRVILGANSSIISTDVQDNSLVLGYFPGHTFKKVNEDNFKAIFLD